jgi:hypothetical protein
VNQLAVTGDNRTRAALDEHVSCSRTRASRIPRRYKACFAPLSAASRLCPTAGSPLFAGMTHGRRGIVASIEKAEQHLAGGLDVVTDALAHRNAVAGDEASQHEVVLCVGGVVIA